ncbi:retrovirus-related pol polyprotein from transposon RE2 [Citrus sinensis]|uniref:Retrovirus-related pol polyprotein from transposon RE2 n=1 Tax=Citrus sinensis TaxID=2711 RepID=A0ACB8NNV0_CITSI|nr:retrovirus-related pol polyprotein from transposon RE2 [Citrus sinensis]
MVTRSKNDIFKPKAYLLALLAQPSELISISQALTDPKWLKAMQEEFQALQANHTWELVLPTVPVKVVGNKWVFRIKYNPDGSILKHKARLVAKGFHQVHGIDYTETFSPVVKASTVRVVLSIAVMNNWILRQIDVNNAFLNGILDQEVYMAQPEGFVNSQKPQHICKLRKAIYGLKQAPRAWFARFRTAMTSQWNFQNSKSDNSLFYKRENGHLLLVLVYVDDIIITGSNSARVQQVIQDMQHTFALKDLGELSYFLGIEVSKLNNGIHLSQAKYIADILMKHDLTHCSPVPTPMSTGQYLTKASGTDIANVSQYRSIIGALQYVTLTRPEISFSVNKLSQFLSYLKSSHWEACKRLLRYLKGTIHFGLQFYNCGALQINCFSDSDWAGDRDDRKSVAGFAVFLGPNLVSWSSKKQSVVSRSSAEAEYRALAHAASEVVWIKSLLAELQVQLSTTPLMWCDNQSAISLAYNPIYHAKTKHVELDIHFIRDKVASKEIDVCFVPSEDQTTDVLTKALTFNQFHYLRSKLNVQPQAFSFQRGC